MLAQLRWGRAWRSAQSRGDGVGSGSSAQALQTAIKTRVVSTGRRGGPSGTTPASGAKRAFHSGQYSVSKNAFGAFQSRDLGQSQQLDEPVLIGEEAAFDASFGSRGVGWNPTNAQLAQGSPHLREPVRLNPFRLAFFRLRRNCEHRVTIGIDLHHPSILF